MDREQSWIEQLSRGSAKMGLALTAAQMQLLVNYLALLCKWNRAFNLTAIRNEDEMVSRQLLDSLSILPFIEGKKILDVGTGPGLPGIPLAVMLPQRKLTLLDSNGKKTRFVQQSKTELELTNINVINGRVESEQQAGGYDTITSRAFSSLINFAEVAASLLAPGGRLVAMKGTLPEDEIRQLEQQGYAIESHVLQVPETTGERHAVIITPDEGQSSENG